MKCPYCNEEMIKGYIQCRDGAACDVFENEPPLDKNHPLLHSPNTMPRRVLAAERIF